MPVTRTYLRWIALIVLVPVLFAAGAAGLMGYFDPRAFVLEKPTVPRKDDLVAVYWTGDMGMRVGIGRRIIDRMREDGIPVLTASSPRLFARQRTAAFAERMVARSIRQALSEGQANRVAIVASSFGADMVVATLGHLAPQLRKTLVSVVLLGPGKRIYFHANPTGLFYHGPSAVNPAETVPLLGQIPIICIYGSKDGDSLCPERAMNLARRVEIQDGHMMLHSYSLVADAVLDGVRHPPVVRRAQLVLNDEVGILGEPMRLRCARSASSSARSIFGGN